MIENSKIFNLKLINSRLIHQTLEKNNTEILLALASRIKRALKIIQKYHISKKRILFIGNPFYINAQLTKILKKSRHAFIPRFAWVAGHITNRLTRSKKSRRNFSKTKIFSINTLKKKSSLVVIIDELIDPIALKEHHSARIPVISLNSQTNPFNDKSAFKIPAKLVPMKADLNLSLFYSLLIAVLKKSVTKKYSRYSKHITRKKPKKVRSYKLKKSYNYHSKNKNFSQKHDDKGAFQRFTKNATYKNHNHSR
jgi:ribosomal protein S2